MSLKIHGALKIISSAFNGVSAQTYESSSGYTYQDFYTPAVGECGWLQVRLSSEGEYYYVQNETTEETLAGGLPLTPHPDNYAYFIYSKTSATDIDIVQVSGDEKFYVYWTGWEGPVVLEGWEPGPSVAITNQSGTLRIGISPDDSYRLSDYLDPGPHIFTADEWGGAYTGDTGMRESLNIFTGDIVGWRRFTTT